MRNYTDSDIFIRMNTGNGLYGQLTKAVRTVNKDAIINMKLAASLAAMNKTYKDTISAKVSTAVNRFELILVTLPIDCRFPANIPFIKTKRNGNYCMIIDLSKYAVVKRNDNDEIEEVTCDINKLYNILVPAYIALNVLNNTTVLSSETIKWMSLMWAKMFNKVLMSQKIFVGNAERYEAFMYFAMRFFMSYYIQCPAPVIEKISMGYLNSNKSKYISFVESNLHQKNIDLYKDWNTFAYTMFSNEITNLKGITGTEINAEYYLKLFASSMGRDGAYLALWSIDYFFYCLFITYNKAYILNDRNWEDIVLKDKKIMPKVINSLYNELA